MENTNFHLKKILVVLNIVVLALVVVGIVGDIIVNLMVRVRDSVERGSTYCFDV